MIDEYIQDVMTKKQIPGLSVAVVREGNPLLLMKGYGIANLEHSVPATEKTVYEVAWVGKTFTATMVMMLVEEGVIELDRAIAAFKIFTDITLTVQDVEIQGDLLVEYGIFNSKNIADTQNPQAIAGKYVVAWKKINGHWKLHRDIFNAD